MQKAYPSGGAWRLTGWEGMDNACLAGAEWYKKAVNYEDLHRQYYQRIVWYLRSIVGPTDAEDVAQEVFAKISTKLSTLKEPSKVSPWLFKIAVNRARDLLRQRNRLDARPQRGPEASSDPLGCAPDTRGVTPEERLQHDEMVECYLDFVRQLPKRYFDVYVLAEIEQLEDRAIGKRLQLPLSTVKMRLHRARAKLYETLRGRCRCYTNARGELMGTLK